MSKRIRVAVDARPLESDLSGIGQYTFFLLQSLCDLDGYEWFLLSNTSLEQKELLKHSHVHSVPSGIVFPKAGTWLSQTRFPFWCSRNTIDLFWSPRHHLPLALPPRVVSILTVHDVVWKKAPETMVWGRRMLEALLMPPSLKKAQHVIVDSHSTKKDIIEQFTFLNPQKLSVIPLGATVNPISSALHNKGKPYILFIGTLEPRKNLSRLLSAYQQLPSALREKYDLVIVGGQGWGKENIHTLSNKLGLADSVQVRGYLEQEEMTTVLAHAEMLAMPSLYEGFGLPLLDAMTLGIPVMCSNISSMPEVTGSAALLIDPYNKVAMKDAMEKLLTDDTLRDNLITLGHEQAKRFSWKRAAAATAQVFENAMASVSSTWT